MAPRSAVFHQYVESNYVRYMCSAVWIAVNRQWSFRIRNSTEAVSVSVSFPLIFSCDLCAGYQSLLQHTLNICIWYQVENHLGPVHSSPVCLTIQQIVPQFRKKVFIVAEVTYCQIGAQCILSVVISAIWCHSGLVGFVWVWTDISNFGWYIHGF